jgi:hypothetical protein
VPPIAGHLERQSRRRSQNGEYHRQTDDNNVSLTPIKALMQFVLSFVRTFKYKKSSLPKTQDRQYPDTRAASPNVKEHIHDKYQALLSV